MKNSSSSRGASSRGRRHENHARPPQGEPGRLPAQTLRGAGRPARDTLCASLAAPATRSRCRRGLWRALIRLLDPSLRHRSFDIVGPAISCLAVHDPRPGVTQHRQCQGILNQFYFNNICAHCTFCEPCQRVQLTSWPHSVVSKCWRIRHPVPPQIATVLSLSEDD